jgi:hypothetical protein
VRFPAHLGDHANKSEGTSAAASEQGQAQEFLGKSRRLCRMRSGLEVLKVLISNFFRPDGQFVRRTCDPCLSLRCYRLSRCTSALIPIGTDPHALTQSRRPMDMMVQG